jgi:beta-lactamase regulating signal transducer with metallopeptidase domain
MIQAICWTLMHSLWQGLIFAVSTAGVLLLTRKASAAVRYNIISILFLLFIIVCGGTFLYELAGASPGENTIAGPANNASPMAMWIIALGKFCSEHAVLIVWVWFFIFAVKSLHMLGGYLYSQRVRHYGISIAPDDWQARLDRLCGQMGIRRAVRLAESKIAQMPLVIGHLRPIILMPLGLITGLPEGEIEAVLLHELAHIRRNDYIINFIQNIAINFFFFNPGLLWMSSLLREEREHCCDDIAIARTHDRAGFIRALIRFKEHDLRLAGVATAFPGSRDRLVKRAMRIAYRTGKTFDPVEKIFLGISLVLISMLVAATSGSSSTPVKVAQIPGGVYRFVVDTPESRVLEPEKNEQEQENSVLELDNERIAMEKKRAADAPTRITSRKVTVDKDVVNAMHINEDQLEEVNRTIRIKQLAEIDRAVRRDQQEKLEREQAEHDEQQAERADQQAARDKEQAIRDKKQADRDAQQYLLDKLQAERDAKQVTKEIQPSGH